MTVDDHIKAITKDGKKSWLVIKGVRLNYEPPRNENGQPLNLNIPDRESISIDRFAFQVDGFTQLDAEIIGDDSLKILSNTSQVWERRRGNFDEDDAFRGDEFRCGESVNWNQMRNAIRKYIELSCKRANNYYEIEWDEILGE